MVNNHGINLEDCTCHPVIDILPDLSAIRCFGMSLSTKTKIKDFDNIDKLRKYYIENFDCKLILNKPYNQCETCKLFINKKCNSGCFANKKE